MSAAAVIIIMAHKVSAEATQNIPLTEGERTFMLILGVVCVLVIVGILLWENWR